MSSRRVPLISSPAGLLEGSRTGTGWTWIANAWVDLAFLILTPALVIPAIALARTRFTVEEIALYVTAFGATGHHFPGMLRAYGDRELFHRFRIRFLVAPILLVSACVLCSYWNLHGLMLIGVTWGIWHSLMQVYGFLRIYDGKVRSVDPLTARLDFLICLFWFGLGFLNSSGRQAHWIDTYYRSGGLALSSSHLRQLTLVWGALTILVTIAFVMNLIRRRREGFPASPLKLLLLIASIGFWWYALVLVDNPLLSAALFEIFHDVQYLTIVWIFNRGRAAKSKQAGAFTRFLFRRSGAMVGLYLALVFGYGIIGLAPDLTGLAAIKPGLYGLLLASGLLHFYYDGFIWKFREPSARRALNLTEESPASAPAVRPALWLGHAAKWMCLVIPAIGLAVAQLSSETSRIEQLRRLTATVPHSWSAHHLLASELLRQNQLQPAIDELKRALELSPRQARVHKDLADACRALGLTDRARVHYARVVELDSRQDEAARALGEILLDQQRYAEAESHFRRLLARLPQDAELHNSLGSALAARGKTAEAAEQFQESLRIEPRSATAHNNLGLMRLRKGDVSAAGESFRESLRIDPDYVEAHNNMGVVCALQADLPRAIEHYRRAVELDPAYFRAVNSLAWNLATAEDDSVRNGAEAIQLAQRLTAEVDASNPSYWNTLGAALAEVKRFDEARQAAEKAVELSRKIGDQRTYQSALLACEAYRQSQPYPERGRR